MVYVRNMGYQKAIVLFFAVIFIILQTCFTIKGTNIFLIFPSVFLILTFKPKLLSYSGCFALGLVNDVFAIQMLGVSSVIFVALKYFKTINVTRGYKSYHDLLTEYLIYATCVFIVTSVVAIVLGNAVLNFSLLISAILLTLGFFVCDFLWLKIFRLISSTPV